MKKHIKFKRNDVVIAHTATGSVYIGKVVSLGTGFSGPNSQLVTIEGIDGKKNTVAGGYCRLLTHADTIQRQAIELHAVNDTWNAVRAMLKA